MNTPTPPPDSRLLVALQAGLPFVQRPFASIGNDLGLSEDAVLAQVHALFEAGVARRFGAVFDSQSLGYQSTLCAADIPPDTLAAAAARIAPHPGITHCYEREGHPNLWFTLTAPAAELKQELRRVAEALGGYDVLDLPALRKFKIEAVFGRDKDAQPSAPRPPPATARPAPPLAERERQVVRRLQANITVAPDPFGLLATELGFDAVELLQLMNRWKDSGVIRRIGLVLRHGKLGFSANSMCVWPVTADRIAAAGNSMALSPHVTHCYERPSSTAFPYNLYAMIHARSRDEAVGIFEHLGDTARLSNGRMLWSAREFKKSSPIFFCEPPPSLGKPGAA